MKELHEAGEPTSDARGHFFDPYCVEVLRDVVSAMEGNVEIVISSTWRAEGLTAMQELWRERSLPGDVVGVTPHLLFKTRENFKDYKLPPPPRGAEIEAWLLNNRDYEFEEYCIVDDDRDMILMQATRFVHTSWDMGLEERHKDHMLTALAGKNIEHDFKEIAFPWKDKEVNKVGSIIVPVYYETDSTD